MNAILPSFSGSAYTHKYRESLGTRLLCIAMYHSAFHSSVKPQDNLRVRDNDRGCQNVKTSRYVLVMCSVTCILLIIVLAIIILFFYQIRMHSCMTLGCTLSDKNLSTEYAFSGLWLGGWYNDSSVMQILHWLSR